MSTMIQGEEGSYVVSTMVKDGKQRKRPRLSVQVREHGTAALVEEITKQAVAARAKVGIHLT